MPSSRPPLTPEQVVYLESAASILIGSCSALLVPEGVRGVGMRVHPGGTVVSVLLPTALAGRTLANLAEHPQLSVTTAAYPTFSSVQLKGRCTATRTAHDGDRALASSFAAKFAAEFAWAGQQVLERARVTTWPCTELELAIDTIYTEAPAPLQAASPPTGPKA